MRSELIEFTNILQQHGLGSREAKRFRAEHADDGVFQERADVVESLFRNRKALGRRKPVHSMSQGASSMTVPRKSADLHAEPR